MFPIFGPKNPVLVTISVREEGMCVDIAVGHLQRLPDQLNSCGEGICPSFPVKLSLMSSVLQVQKKTNFRSSCFSNDTGPERWVEVTPAETANTLQQAERSNEREWEGERGESAQGRKSKAREAEVVRS